jgi:hypothetical protein
VSYNYKQTVWYTKTMIDEKFVSLELYYNH